MFNAEQFQILTNPLIQFRRGGLPAEPVGTIPLADRRTILIDPAPLGIVQMAAANPRRLVQAADVRRHTTGTALPAATLPVR